MPFLITFLFRIYSILVIKKIFIVSIIVTKFSLLIIVGYHLLKIIMFLTDTISYIVNYMNDKVSSGNSDLASWGFAVVSSMGIWDAFVSSIILFSPILISLFLYKLYKFLTILLTELQNFVKNTLSL